MTTVRQNSLAKNLRALRGTMSQRQFCYKTGILHRETLAHYEAGLGNPRMTHLWDLADFFNVSIDELIGREHYENSDKLS